MCSVILHFLPLFLLSKYAESNFLKITKYKICKLFIIGQNLTPHLIFLKHCPFKALGIVESVNIFLSIPHPFCAFGEYAESFKGALGDMGNLGLCAIHKIVPEFAEINKTYSENTRKESMRTWRRHKEPPVVFT